MKNSDSIFIRTFFIILMTIAGLQFMTGCATAPTVDSVAQKAVEWLQNNESVVEGALTIAGKKALQYAVNDQDRKIISNEMYAAAVAFRSLEVGSVISPEQVKATLQQFGAGANSASYSGYITDVSLIWGMVQSQIKISGDAKLGVEYLELLARTAENVAATYKDS